MKCEYCNRSYAPKILHKHELKHEIDDMCSELKRHGVAIDYKPYFKVRT